jgi:hypothetical protein
MQQMPIWQELNIKDVFVPDENVEYYSNEEL